MRHQRKYRRRSGRPYHEHSTRAGAARGEFAAHLDALVNQTPERVPSHSPRESLAQKSNRDE